MRFTTKREAKRETAAINEIMMKEVQDVLKGRAERDGLIRQAQINEGAALTLDERLGVDAKKNGQTTMTKKAIKINTAQLRGLIKEAIMAKPFGQPEGVWINEEVTTETHLSEQLEDVVRKYFANLYDADDPSMAHAGKKEWEAQAAAAAAEFVDRSLDLIDEIDAKLIDGEYYSGSRANEFGEVPLATGYKGGEADVVDLPPMHPRGR